MPTSFEVLGNYYFVGCKIGEEDRIGIFMGDIIYSTPQ
jgi:hypothetical protein